MQKDDISLVARLCDLLLQSRSIGPLTGLDRNKVSTVHRSMAADPPGDLVPAASDDGGRT
jgi:hypothetical protein